MADNSNFNQKLAAMFSMFSFRADSKKGVQPLKKSFKGRGQEMSDKDIEQFPPYVRHLWNTWRQNQSMIYSFEDRFAMYKEMFGMFENNALMNNGKELTINEIVQGDTNNQIISVEAKDKNQRKHIENALIRLNVDGNLYPTASNLVCTGDAGWILTFFDKGVQEILNVDPFDIDDRIEFTPHDVEKELRNTGFTSMFRNITNDKKMQMLAQNILEQKDYASFFRSYLFGFQVGSFVLPPWRFLHFRNFETNSFFAPFGVPNFIYSLAPTKMYDMALGLQILQRQANMPTDVYKLVFPEGGMPTDKIELATSFIRYWQSSGLQQIRKENNGLGEAQIIIKDLYEWEQQSPNINLGRIDDIEMMRDDIVISTGLPRNFLDPNNGAFGNSGVSLIQQFKPFARKVYKYQTILLEQISQLIKIDMIQSGKFNIEDIDFKLSMPYPESQNNPELISSQRDLFNLANEVLDGIKERIGAEVPLPSDLVKQVYKKVTSFDPETIDKWVDDFVQERDKLEKEQAEIAQQSAMNNSGQEGGEPVDNRDFTFESLRRKSSPKIIDTVIDEEISKGRIGFATEHKANGRHYLSSRKVNSDFDIKLFEKFKVDSKIQLMNEELKIRNPDKFKAFKEKAHKSVKRVEVKKRMNENLFPESTNPDDIENFELNLDDLNKGE